MRGRCINIEDKQTAYEFFEMLKAVSDMWLAEAEHDEA